MLSGKALLTGVVGRFLFRSAAVRGVEPLGSRFRRVTIGGPALCDARFNPGDKVQLFIPDAGLRTYTPMFWDHERGLSSFLFYAHGTGPGSLFSQALALGDAVQFFGPRGSLDLQAYPGKRVLFGDETAIALAWSFWELRGGKELSLLFEVSNVSESQNVLDALGMKATLIERRTDEAHLGAIAERLAAAKRDGYSPVYAGRAHAIQALKRSLGSDGKGPTKAYWSLGKTGLD